MLHVTFFFDIVRESEIVRACQQVQFNSTTKQKTPTAQFRPTKYEYAHFP